MNAIERIDAERKHLEGLLKDRISFFLLYAPVLVAASYNIQVTVHESRVTLHSALIPAALITFPHFAISSFRNAVS
jgi:hypothetical protein